MNHQDFRQFPQCSPSVRRLAFLLVISIVCVNWSVVEVDMSHELKYRSSIVSNEKTISFFLNVDSSI